MPKPGELEKGKFTFKRTRPVEFKGRKYPAHYRFFDWAVAASIIQDNEVVGIAPQSGIHDKETRLVWIGGGVIQMK